MKEASKLAKDRPMSAVDTAVWWTEYVLRTDDVSHLKSPGIHQSWWERRLLHIWAPLFFAFFNNFSPTQTFMPRIFPYCEWEV